jgi:hypothetical protein
VYGLIFLFQYRESDDDDENDDPSEIPRDVWFANQVSIALGGFFSANHVYRQPTMHVLLLLC